VRTNLVVGGYAGFYTARKREKELRRDEARPAMRGKHLAKDIVALRGRKPKPYVHRSLGTVATLGLGRGAFQYHGIVIKGLPPGLMHRGYHLLGVPSRERKPGVPAVWLTAAVFGRNIGSRASVLDPRREFVTSTEPVEPVSELLVRLDHADSA
jgi:NADH dehydrogenase